MEIAVFIASAMFSEVSFNIIKKNWRGGRGSQQNFLGYNFKFLMVPLQTNNPKSSYYLLRENSIIAIYYPLIFVAD
jgi:hypothetical protein